MNREQKRIYNAKWRAENREQRRAYQANWYAQNRGQQCAYQAEWRAEHPAYWAKWYVEHREQQCAFFTNRRHRKRANGGNFPRAAWEHLKALFGHRCAYCGRRMERLTQDHIVPISKGGWHFSGNIVPACQSCNSRKGASVRV